MSRRPDIVLVYGAGLVQGLALVTFPATSDVFTSPSFHDLSSSQYGSLFLPMVVTAIVASTVGGPLAHRKGLKPVKARSGSAASGARSIWRWAGGRRRRPETSSSACAAMRTT